MKGERVGLVLALCALLGCGKFKSLIGGDSPDATASATPVATAPAVDRAPGEGVCSPGERKLWATWPNRHTGITPARIGGKPVVGVAIGNTPHLLVLDAEGGGRLVKLSPAPGSALARNVRSPEVRELHRVTPAEIAGKLSAYADYRDTYRDKRRRVACGAVESARAMVAFEGKPLLDREEEKPDEPAPAASSAPPAAVGPIPRLKLPKKGAPGAVQAPGLRVPPAAAAAAPPTGDAAAPTAPPAATTATPRAAPEKKRRVSEVRDCRTFVDDDGSVWAVASELSGEPQDDGSHKWSMRFYAAPEAGRGYVTLHTVALPKEPKTLATFDTPAGAAVGKGHVLFARYQGSLFGWALGAGFRPSGGVRVYRNGFPTMPHLTEDGSALWVLTSLRGGESNYAVHATKLTGPSLPPSLDPIDLTASEPSLAEPTLAKAGEQRWLAYQAGSGREGRLRIVPVNEALAPAGRAYDVTEPGATVQESYLFGLGEGKLLAVYIRKGDPAPELISQVLSCSVKN